MTLPRETFGQRMKRVRLLRRGAIKRKSDRYSQAAIARAAGISQSCLSKIEHDHLEPGLYVAMRIADYLEFSLKGLVEKP
jgi:DNA-binding XRE family transcriptional regulator